MSFYTIQEYLVFRITRGSAITSPLSLVFRVTVTKDSPSCDVRSPGPVHIELPANKTSKPELFYPFSTIFGKDCFNHLRLSKGLCDSFLCLIFQRYQVSLIEINSLST